MLATDGFIVYDIQDEACRTEVERPFPFRKNLDAAWYASLFLEATGKHCVVYKSVVEESIEKLGDWVDNAIDKYGHNCFNLVGAPSSSRQYKGPTLVEGMNFMKSKPRTSFGCVAIPERHTKKVMGKCTVIFKSILSSFDKNRMQILIMHVPFSERATKTKTWYGRLSVEQTGSLRKGFITPLP